MLRFFEKQKEREKKIKIYGKKNKRNNHMGEKSCWGVGYETQPALATQGKGRGDGVHFRQYSSFTYRTQRAYILWR